MPHNLTPKYEPSLADLMDVEFPPADQQSPSASLKDMEELRQSAGAPKEPEGGKPKPLSIKELTNRIFDLQRNEAVLNADIAQHVRTMIPFLKDMKLFATAALLEEKYQKLDALIQERNEMITRDPRAALGALVGMMGK